MTIPEIKQKYTDRIGALKIMMDLANGSGKVQRAEKIIIYKELIADLDTLPECNGKVIDYTKETCTSCGCKNHKTE